MAHGVEVECKIHVARCDTATHEQEASAVVLWVGVEGGGGATVPVTLSRPPQYPSLASCHLHGSADPDGDPNRWGFQ